MQIGTKIGAYDVIATLGDVPQGSALYLNR